MAFTIPEGSFEPMVMFFGLTNSPVTFQTMMNKILQDLINTEKMDGSRHIELYNRRSIIYRI